MRSEKKVIALSQRVVEIPEYGEQRDCLDQEWTLWLESLDYLGAPIPNRFESPSCFLDLIRPSAIVLTGGNNLTLKVYDDLKNGTKVMDAYECRDNTERGLIDYAIRERIPLLGCCRGMQFIQSYFGGTLSRIDESASNHVAKNHSIRLIDERFSRIAESESLIVNSYHDYGINESKLASPLRGFAHSTGDSLVEGFIHENLPIVGIMWHPERSNPAAGFDKALSKRLFESSLI